LLSVPREQPSRYEFYRAGEVGFVTRAEIVAIAAAVAIFGGFDHDVSFVFGGALFGCFSPGAQHGVWKSSVTSAWATCTNSPDSKIRLVA
jgi:hypothetical protein